MKLPKLPKHYGFASIVIICAIVLKLEFMFPEYIDMFVARDGWTLLYTSITSAFLHGGFDHFFFNMFFVAPLALLYERKYGTKKFLIDWLICAAGSCFFFFSMPTMFGHGSCLGASGACSGLMALGLLNYRKDRLHEVLALLALGGFFMANLLPGIVDCLFPSGVAHMGHVGGILTGVLLHVLNVSREQRCEKPCKPR